MSHDEDLTSREEDWRSSKRVETNEAEMRNFMKGRVRGGKDCLLQQT